MSGEEWEWEVRGGSNQDMLFRGCSAGSVIKISFKEHGFDSQNP